VRLRKQLVERPSEPLGVLEPQLVERHEQPRVVLERANPGALPNRESRVPTPFLTNRPHDIPAGLRDATISL